MNGVIRTVQKVTTPKVTATAAAPPDEIVADGGAVCGGGGGAESISEVPRPNIIQGRRRHAAVVSLARPSAVPSGRLTRSNTQQRNGSFHCRASCSCPRPLNS